ncbi:MAG: hypothetical protein JNK58_01105 [Phycisphaerae bacterium]|nr:hypothetical protein [Phycisphaerae bacterium]
MNLNRLPGLCGVSFIILHVTFTPPRAAQAQPVTIYAGGVEHAPVGSATVTKTDRRRVRSSGIGSSGQDGVEIKLRTLGSDYALGIDPGLMPPGEEITIRRKGWDGTIKGSWTVSRVPGGGTNIILDYSGSAASSVRIVGYDAAGDVAFDASGAGPTLLWNLPPDGAVNPWGCPGGGQPVLKIVKIGDEEIMKWVCPGSVWDNTRSNGVGVTFDRLPPGDPDIAITESVIVTGSTMTQFDVFDAAIFRDGHEVSGVDGSHMVEQCVNPGGCTENDRRIKFNNLGSSGEDGATIDLGATHPDANEDNNNGGISFSKDSNCCYHVTLMKLTDDDASEQRIRREVINPLLEMETLECDFSDYGATGYMLFLYGVDGSVIGPPMGTFLSDGQPKPIITGRCPVGQAEIWENAGEPKNPVWIFVGCGINNTFAFTLPGGTLVPGVASFSIQPVGLTTPVGSHSRLELLQDDTGGSTGLKLHHIARTPKPPCPGDADGSGAVNFGDVTSVLANFGHAYQVGRAGAGDADRNYAVNFGDITSVLANFGHACGAP